MLILFCYFSTNSHFVLYFIIFAFYFCENKVEIVQKGVEIRLTKIKKHSRKCLHECFFAYSIFSDKSGCSCISSDTSGCGSSSISATSSCGSSSISATSGCGSSSISATSGSFCSHYLVFSSSSTTSGSNISVSDLACMKYS